MQYPLLFWFVLEATDSPFKVALVGFFGGFAGLFAGCFSGFLADKFNRLVVSRATILMDFLGSCSLTVFLMFGLASQTHAYMVAAIAGAAWAIDFASRRSLVYDLLGSDGVTNGMALDSGALTGSKMVGPALGGILIGLLSVKGAYGFVALFFGVALMLSFTLTINQNKQLQSLGGSLWRNVYDSWLYVKANKPILGVVIITILMCSLVFTHQSMIPVIARDVLNVGPVGMGVLISASGFGSMIAIIIVATFRTRRHGLIYLGGCLFTVLCLIGFAMSTKFHLSLPILLVAGLGVGTFSTFQGALTMLVAKTEMRGRALGVIAIANGAGFVGVLLMGYIAEQYSPSTAILFCSTLALIGITLVGLCIPSLIRKVEVEANSV